MILGIEIALLFFGISALIRGKFSAGKNKVVTGSKARVLGVICLLPLPLAFTAGLAWAILAARGVLPQPDVLAAAGVEFCIVISVAIGVVVLAGRFYQQQQQFADQLAANAEFSAADDQAQKFTIEDPNNPFASPTTGPR